MSSTDTPTTSDASPHPLIILVTLKFELCFQKVLQLHIQYIASPPTYVLFLYDVGIVPITDWIFSGSRDATARLWALEDPGSGTGWIQKTLFKGHTSYVTCLVYSSSDEQYKHVRQAFLLTPAAEKGKTQNINSTSEVHFLHNEKNSRKKTISNFSLETEIFLWGVSFYANFMIDKYFPPILDEKG